MGREQAMTYYVHVTVNVGQREYNLTLPKAISLDNLMLFLREQYSDATSMVLSVVFDEGEALK